MAVAKRGGHFRFRSEIGEYDVIGFKAHVDRPIR